MQNITQGSIFPVLFGCCERVAWKGTSSRVADERVSLWGSIIVVIVSESM